MQYLKNLRNILRSLDLLLMLFLFTCLSACSSDGGSDMQVDGDAENEVDGDIDVADGDVDRDADHESELESEEFCGDSFCTGGENCLNCLEDCDCSCGDGVCSFGEFCSNCQADCDCQTLAATPPMGWNSWNKFACNINEELIRDTADQMVETGMLDAGYEYLNLDDCWQLSRDEQGRIVADPERFPSGIAALAEYVHSKGLKFGLYTCAGTLTCQERPGSFEHEQIDAETYAEWGVDYIKVDWCFTDGMDARTRYTAMHDALQSVARPIVFSICNWGYDDPHVWGSRTGQLWRTTGDIADLFGSMLANFRMTEDLSAFSGKGHWNDPDMLEVGNGGMSTAEYRAHMSLWAIIAAPLIAGNDLRNMDADTQAILLNKEVIAVDQDPLALAGVRVSDDVWARPLAYPGLRAVVLLNSDSIRSRTREITWEQLGLEPGTASVRDIWAGQDLGQIADSYLVNVPPHDAVMLLVQGRDVVPNGEVALGDAVFKHAANSIGPVERNLAVGGEGSGDGGPLTIGGKNYASGIGLGGAAYVMVHLGGNCSRFSATVGIDTTAAGGGSVIAQVFADGDALFKSDVLTGTTAPVSVDVDVSGRQDLLLYVDSTDDSIEGDFTDWVDAKLICNALEQPEAD
jgi:alpha-galactosidase